MDTIEASKEKVIVDLAQTEGVCATINDIHDWICSAKKGDVAIYFTGELSAARILMKDSIDDPTPAADFVWSNMRRGLVCLVQKRGNRIKKQLAHNYIYMMQRTGVSL